MHYHIFVKKTKDRGRGVFAGKNFLPGAVIERCPILKLSESDAKMAQKTLLDNYLYDWDGIHKSCLPLGYGLIYNHSYQPNARYYFDYVKGHIVYKAIGHIRRGLEITVNYNFDPDDSSPTDVSDVPHRNKA